MSKAAVKFLEAVTVQDGRGSGEPRAVVVGLQQIQLDGR